MPHPSPKALIFDLDDTLIPSSSFYGQAVRFALSQDSSLLTHYEAARKSVKASLPPLHTSARNRLLYFKRCLEIAGLGALSSLQLMDRYESELSRLIREWSRTQGRLGLLRKLQTRYPLYILTNEIARTQLLKIEALCDGPSTPFQGIVCSEEAGYEKPARQIFALLFERFNLRPEECLMVGDDLENDIIPAKDWGISVIHTREFAQPGSMGTVHPFINHLDELMDILS